MTLLTDVYACLYTVCTAAHTHSNLLKPSHMHSSWFLPEPAVFLIPCSDMRELSVYDVSSSSRKFIKENLLVTLGEDVEVECSTTASEAPQYFWQKYVSLAFYRSISHSLSRSSFSLSTIRGAQYSCYSLVWALLFLESSLSTQRINSLMRW